MKIDYQWTDELRDYPDLSAAATGGRIKIDLNGINICRHYDEAEGEAREWLEAPLVQVAEWLANNYFFILFETDASRSHEWRHRHVLSTIGEGFAWPALEFQARGKIIELSVQPYHHEFAKIDFRGSAKFEVEVTELRDILGQFLEAVSERLTASGIENSSFQELWEDIRMLDEEEWAFAKASAELGEHPFLIDDHRAEEILKADQYLPESLKDDFYRIARGLDLVSTAKTLGTSFEEFLYQPSLMSDASAIKKELNGRKKIIRPLEIGYSLARRVRKVMGFIDGQPIQTKNLLQYFGVAQPQNSFGLFPKLPAGEISERTSGLMVVNENDNPIIAFSAGKEYASELSSRFAFCRAVSEYFVGSRTGSRLLTEVQTTHQKQNRAFAAEFLAPAEGIKQILKGRRYFSFQDVKYLADHFGVSSQTIQDQVVNHEIAGLE